MSRSVRTVILDLAVTSILLMSADDASLTGPYLYAWSSGIHVASQVDTDYRLPTYMDIRKSWTARDNFRHSFRMDRAASPTPSGAGR